MAAKEDEGWDEIDDSGWDDEAPSAAAAPPAAPSASARAPAPQSAVSAPPAVPAAAPAASAAAREFSALAGPPAAKAPVAGPSPPAARPRATGVPAAEAPAAGAAPPSAAATPAPAARAVPAAVASPQPPAAAPPPAPQQQPQAPPRHQGSGSLFGTLGLPGGLSLTQLGSSLKDAARAAAKDAAHLAEALQQGLAEATADPESEAERLSHYQAPRDTPTGSGSGGGTAAGGPAGPAAAAPPAVVEAARGSGSGSGGLGEGWEEVDEQEVRRRGEVLRRLEGDDGSVVSGLKAIDESVEQLAAGAAKALGSLWGGLGAVARTVTHQVETATHTITREIEGAGSAVPLSALRSAAEQFGATLEKGLETVGRGMLEAFEPLAGDHRRPHRHSGGPGGRGSTTESGFAHSFDLFGGAEALDELCDLSNECSRILNRARAALGPQHAATMDAALARIAPIFDLSRPDSEAGAGASADSGSGGEDGGGVDAAYGPVHSLVAKAQKKAALMGEDLAMAVADEIETAAASEAASGAGAAAAAERLGSGEIEPAPEAGSGGAGASEGAGGGEGEEEEEPEWVRRWRAAAERSLGEVCAGDVMILLQHARSLSAPARYGRPLDDGLEWPADSAAAARLLRTQAVTMSADLSAVAAAFVSPLRALTSPQEQLPSSAVAAAASAAVPRTMAARAEALAAQLEADRDQALARVSDSLRETLFVLLLVGLHREGRLSGPPPQATDGEGVTGDEQGAAAAQRQEGSGGGAGQQTAAAAPAAAAERAGPPVHLEKAD